MDSLGDGLAARYLEFAVRAVACPQCAEVPGQLCRGKGKNKLLGTVHAARRQALRQVKKDDPTKYERLRREIVLQETPAVPAVEPAGASA